MLASLQRTLFLLGLITFFGCQVLLAQPSLHGSTEKELPAEKAALLHQKLATLAKKHPGRVGIGVQSAGSVPILINGDQRFSLQSVMKLLVGAAAMHAVDEGRMKLDDPVTIRRQDLSVNIQPIADIVAEKGVYQTTLGDLIERAVIQSDSAATDFLILKLGGTPKIRAWLEQTGIRDLRIDRTERELQTEATGLKWQENFVYPERLEAARKSVSPQNKQAAFDAYLKDERDTSTPKSMVEFLSALQSGKLLKPDSTQYFLKVMHKTVTFPDRLRAGVPKGWKIGHKTGTSKSLNGINGVTNDVGIMTTPDGQGIAIAVFIAESTASAKERAALIAETARLVAEAYSTK